MHDDVFALLVAAVYVSCLQERQDFELRGKLDPNHSPPVAARDSAGGVSLLTSLCIGKAIDTKCGCEH